MERIGRHLIDIEDLSAVLFQSAGDYGNRVNLVFFTRTVTEVILTDGELELLYDLADDEYDHSPDDGGGSPVVLPHTDITFDNDSHHYVTDPERQAA